jgi:hypothetical protein
MLKQIFAVSCAAVAVFGLAGCKSSAQVTGSAGVTQINPAPSTPITTAPASKPAPAVTVTVTATAKPVSVKPCKVADLSIKVGGNSGAAGTLVQLFTVKNKSSVTCTMNKYPGISPFGLQSQGSSKVQANFDWKVDPIPSGDQQIGAVGGLQTLAPGGTAIFFLKWSQVPVGDGKCGDASGFEFQAPQYLGTAGDYLEVDFNYTACGEELQVSQVMSPSAGGGF